MATSANKRADLEALKALQQLNGYGATQSKNDYVAMRIYEHEGTASGLIEIPEQLRQSIPPTCEVVSVGPQAEHVCKKDDIIYCAARAYQPLRMEYETLYVCTADAVLGVVTDLGDWAPIIERKRAERQRQATLAEQAEEHSGILVAAN